MTPEETGASPNFVRDAIMEDTGQGRFGGRVHTRWPPEPNGYLHIGHAKAMCMDFGFALEFGGKCNLRFDDTNPVKEDVEYVDAIREDIHWLGFDWEEREFYASDYFDQLYEFAVQLIQKGKAYVDDLSADADPRVPRHAHRARQGQPLPRPLRGGEPGPLRPHDAPASSPTAPACCGPRSTWPRAT